MKKTARILLFILSLLLWTVFIGLGFTEGYLLRGIANNEQGFMEASQEIIRQRSIGNIALALIENNQIGQSYFYSANNEVINEDSAFPVASISKWITALGVLKLVEAGEVDLDEPVDAYLSRWHLPKSEYNNSEVTIRRLLSHSAGFEDGLGYNGFTAEEEPQSLEESLTRAADGYDEGGEARVSYPPGNGYMYSGASYTLLQLMIEEVSEKSFPNYMDSAVFTPLDMNHSSFTLADSSKIGLVSVYRTDGTTRPMNRFTAKAAASLITSVSDLSKALIAVSKNDGNVLSKTMVNEMISAQAFRNGYPYYGLGPRLHLKPGEGLPVVGHDGSGNDAINTAARLDMDKGAGIIVLSSGDFSIASDLADEWMFWKASIADRVVMERNIPYLLKILGLGYVLIVSLYIFLRKKQLGKLQS